MVDALLARLVTPETALQKRRLEMLAWLASARFPLTGTEARPHASTNDRRPISVALPIKIHRIPGGYSVDLADGRRLWTYGREPEITRQANVLRGKCVA